MVVSISVQYIRVDYLPTRRAANDRQKYLVRAARAIRGFRTSMSRRTEGTGFRELMYLQRSAFGRAVVSALDFLTPPQPERAIFGPGGPLRQIEQRTVTLQIWRPSPTGLHAQRQSLALAGQFTTTRPQFPTGTIQGRRPTDVTHRGQCGPCPLGPSGPDEELLSRRAFCSQTTAHSAV